MLEAAAFSCSLRRMLAVQLSWLVDSAFGGAGQSQIEAEKSANIINRWFARVVGSDTQAV